MAGAKACMASPLYPKTCKRRPTLTSDIWELIVDELVSLNSVVNTIEQRHLLNRLSLVSRHFSDMAQARLHRNLRMQTSQQISRLQSLPSPSFEQVALHLRSIDLTQLVMNEATAALIGLLPMLAHVSVCTRNAQRHHLQHFHARLSRLRRLTSLTLHFGETTDKPPRLVTAEPDEQLFVACLPFRLHRLELAEVKALGARGNEHVTEESGKREVVQHCINTENLVFANAMVDREGLARVLSHISTCYPPSTYEINAVYIRQEDASDLLSALPAALASETQQLSLSLTSFDIDRFNVYASFPGIVGESLHPFSDLKRLHVHLERADFHTLVPHLPPSLHTVGFLHSTVNDAIHYSRWANSASCPSHLLRFSYPDIDWMYLGCMASGKVFKGRSEFQKYMRQSRNTIRRKDVRQILSWSKEWVAGFRKEVGHADI